MISAAQHYPDHHDCRQPGPCLDPRLHRRPPEAAGAGRLPDCRHHPGPRHTWLCRRHRAFTPTRRDRGDAADVRRWASLFPGRPMGRSPHRRAGRNCPDCGCDGARHGCHHLLGLEPGCRHRVRPCSLRGEHGRAHQDAGKSRRSRVRQRPHRRRLAGGRGPGDGPGPRVAAAAFRVVNRRRKWHD